MCFYVFTASRTWLKFVYRSPGVSEAKRKYLFIKVSKNNVDHEALAFNKISLGHCADEVSTNPVQNYCVFNHDQPQSLMLFPSRFSVLTQKHIVFRIVSPHLVDPLHNFEVLNIFKTYYLQGKAHKYNTQTITAIEFHLIFLSFLKETSLAITQRILTIEFQFAYSEQTILYICVFYYSLHT